MKNRAIVITVILLVISIGTSFRVVTKADMRLVEILSIFAIGALTGLLISQIVKMTKDKDQSH
jgi:hypothetical protein